ncbi:MAG: hypothetical protein KA004_17575 [Verrucomicrobiales bacterium]|nr:hypothetical protein [Verrucomicrobiales bacterium]
MKPSVIIIAAGAAALGAVGGYLGGKSTATQQVNSLEVALAAAKEGGAEKKTAAKLSAESGDSGVVMPGQFRNASLREIFASPGPMDRFQAVMAYVKGLPPRELERALTDVRDQMRGGGFDPEKLFAMHLLLVRYGNENYEGALKYLKGQDPFAQMLGTGTVLASLATKDPALAAKVLAEQNQTGGGLPRSGQMAAQSIAREWAKQDPQAALAWAKELPEGMRGGALEGVLGTMMTENPTGAAKIAMEMPEGDDRARVLGQMAEGWASRNPEEAMKWVAGLPESERGEATKRALNGWAMEDPKAAAAWIGTLPADRQDENLSAVAGRWAWQQPAEAAAWVAGQAEGEGKKEAVRNVMGSWVETQPEAASAWLREQPPGPSKDQGIVALAGSQVKSDPEAAMIWASSISDAEIRRNQVKSTARQWMKKDAAGAEAFVQQTPHLTAEDKSALLTK